MERNQMIAIVVIVVVVAGAGVAFVFLSTPQRPPEDVFVWETIGNPDYMDPHINYESFGSWIHFNIYETLYTYPWDSAVTDPSVPLLASGAAEWNETELSYTVPLRTGITFHDGTPFNASCVQWNFYRAAKIFYLDGPFWMVAEPLLGGGALEGVAFDEGPDSAAFATAFDDWVATDPIEVVNQTAVKFYLEEQYPPFIAAITYEVGAMMSPTFALAHASDAAWSTWDTYGVDYGEWDNYMTEHACGTGPYMLNEWVVDQFIHLIQYDDYWRTSTSTGAGSLEEVYIKTNEDVNGRILNLRTGTIDGCYWPTTNADDIWDGSASTDTNIHVSQGGFSYTVMFFGFNMGDINTTEGDVFTSPFSEINFRKAASYAFDYEAMLDAAVNGFGIQGKGPIPVGMFGHNSSAFTIDYNLTAAVEYWNAAAAVAGFADLIHNLDDSITLYYNSGNTVREQGCLLLKDGLEAVFADEDADMDDFPDGITIAVQALEWSNYLAHIRGRQMPIFFVGWAPDYADPDNYVWPFCYSNGVYSYRIGYNNSDVDQWYVDAKAEPDLDERERLYSLIQEQVAEDCPYIWVYQATEFRTWRTWVHGDGLVYNPMHQIYFYHVYKTYPTT